MWTAILVAVLVMVGVGIVIDQLFRLRDWLNKPPSPRADEPPSDDI